MRMCQNGTRSDPSIAVETGTSHERAAMIETCQRRNPDRVRTTGIGKPGVGGHTTTCDFEAFYRRFFPDVYGYAFNRIRNRHLAEDVAGEVFVRALRNFGEGSSRGHDRAWLITIAHNIMADHAKSSRARREVVTDDPFVHQAAHEDLAEAVVRTLMCRSRYAQVQTALAKLTSDQRDCIVMRYLLDLSVEEVATATGRTRNSVRALQHRAMRRLQATLLDESSSRGIEHQVQVAA